LVKDRLVKDRLVKDRLVKDRLVKDRLVKDRLVKDRLVKGNRQFYDRYFVVEADSNGDRCVRVCDEAILEFKQDVAGFFVLLSNDVPDVVEAYRVYREKDVVEKGFDDLKNGFDLNRLRVHGVEAMEVGCLLCLFLRFCLLQFVRL
jgi:transposase